MRRIVSVWLPRWPTDRLRRSCAPRTKTSSPHDGIDFEAPLGLVISATGGFRLTACNQAAEEEGLYPGQLVTDARALCPELQLAPAALKVDAKALSSLAAWAARYSPWTAPARGANGIDGIFLDVTGCAHLFGGEEALLTDLLRRLTGLGFTVRGGLTSTLGASWALARFDQGRLAQEGGVVAKGGEADVLKPLPIRALRLSNHTEEGLLQVGLKRVGDLMRTPRAPITSRFGAEPIMRLDQALGRAPEPVTPQSTEEPLRATLRLIEPITQIEAVGEGVDRLCEEMEQQLEARGKGGRLVRLSLFRVDGDMATLEVGTARPTRDAKYLARLLRERLERAETDLDSGFGYDALVLDVIRSDRLLLRQSGLDTEDSFTNDLASFVDRAGNRFGWGRVRHAHGFESHIPERAMVAKPAHVGPPPLDWPEDLTRPMALLPCAEPIEVVAEVPEGPPRTFKWRRVAHRVARAEGPERISPEWWRDESSRTRDYYRVEDEEGRRFWIYREGLYGRGSSDPRWYMHGLFG